MLPPQLNEWLRRYLIPVYLFLILIVQGGAAYLAREGYVRTGFFEWSFICKPAIAVMLCGLVDGKPGLKSILGPLVHWRVHVGWYLFAFFSVPVLLVLSVLAHHLIYGNPVTFNPWAMTSFHPRMHFSITMMALADELAFFGFVYARLAPRFTGLLASQIAGIVWTLSYAPRMLMESDMMADNTMPFWALGANLMVIAPICAWVYGSTKSAFLVVVLQVAANLTTLSLPILPKHAGESNYYFAIAGMALGSLLLAAIYGAQHLTKSGLPLKKSTPLVREPNGGELAA